jgi:hypothetical protein
MVYRPVIGRLRAWLEESTFKVFAFAVGSLYVLGKADREHLRVRAIPVVRPSYVKKRHPRSKRLLDSADALRAFLDENKGKLKLRGQEKTKE